MTTDTAGLVDELHWLERHAVGDSLGVQPRACKVAREAASVLIALQAENERYKTALESIMRAVKTPPFTNMSRADMREIAGAALGIGEKNAGG